MAIRVALHHKTSYRYDHAVTAFPHVVRLKPAVHSRTPILSYSFRVGPEPHFINWQQDPFGNHLARLVFPEKTDRLDFTVDLVAELHSINPFDFFLEPDAEQFPFQYSPDVKAQLAPYLALRENGPLLKYYVESNRRKQKTIDFLVELNQRIHSDVSYLIRMEPGVQTCEDTLKLKSGSCRDSAHLLVHVLRGLGLAARFVSGYLIQLKPDETPLSGPPGPAHDFTDLHAWAEVYLPGAGWVGLDATSGLFTSEGHIPLACSPNPEDAAAITGAVEPAKSDFSFEMKVTRIEESPRVSQPYTDLQWKKIQGVGRVVDADLMSHNVRLTSGGEPTFVSQTDRDAPEWNISANGLKKKDLARRLALALRGRFAPGSSFHSGQGKWYPGEEIPRWAYSVFFRKDGRPLWRDDRLLADETRNYNYGPREARMFLEALATRLVGTTETIVPGYEDAYYYLWKEGNLPADVDPMRKDLSSESERNRLRILLERGMGSITGFALPLNFDGSLQSWTTGSWHFRRERMYLIPGDSAMGYRLPLESLSGTDIGFPELSPMQEKSPFPDVAARTLRRAQTILATSGDSSSQTQIPMIHMRTSVCVETRDGRLYVFLSPQWDAANYVDLIASVEDTAAELQMPVLIEGYEPPTDSRLGRIAVTPDPGVVEVNIHPSDSFEEHARKLEILHEEARKCGLTTEKFLHDGRRSGTGGGNHITLGGPTPMESPFLQRPDLLRSLITYFQHHPALSYFFSGQFIGATSQSPRIDETNPESLYELAIAFSQLPRSAVPVPGDAAPWLVDRLLRNLLVDQMGNTHRAEISIDKLHSPDSLTGRLGIVEFRGFEMQYHAQMNSLQHLLMRALVAKFCKEPYRSAPMEWGFMLRDQYRLPHFLWEDLRSIVSDLARAGYDFEESWFLPFLESRFPVYGTSQVEDCTIELRQALEAWQVLGEEMSAVGTARAVDSAVERLQVRVDHFHPERYALLCNGRPVPLQATSHTGTYVAGVRFKAWNPPRTLHPSIPVNSPLFFNLYDRVRKSFVGGCTYHVFHPGGRSYDTS
ncbi:MAG TPA: transglutaminase family protein, partial [Leptospiraceae bacterium]|nr:transglutaminase family protein [Leptospiraceae bacterium]